MTHITINDRRIGEGEPVYIIAEMSANHGQDLGKAKDMIHAMKESGADAVKLQTYTPDTVTINCQNHYFVDCLKGTIWEGQSLYELYGDAFTPWEWQPELKELAESLGMDCFSTPIGDEAIALLEEMNVPAYKISSFEITHLPLIRRISATGKPIILSTGMATQDEIHEALDTAREGGASEIALLKCTSAYPAEAKDANLATILDMMERFDVPVGVSDHTMGSDVSVAAVTLGACIVEKHFILDRKRDKGPDSAFSMEPDEFKEMVCGIRAAETDPSSTKIAGETIGEVTYGGATGERGNRIFRPSIFSVRDIQKGETLTRNNTRIIRPGYGLMPKHIEEILGKKAKRNIERGTPLSWEDIV